MSLVKRLCALALCLLLTRGAAAETAFADFSQTFGPLFLPEGVQCTQSSYRSENLFVDIAAVRACESDVYIANIYVRTVESLQRAFGGEGWNDAAERLGTLAQKSGAVLALSGDNSHLLKAGYLAAGGTLWRERGNNKRDLCVLYTDGTMTVYPAPADHEAIGRQFQEGLIWQTFVFGPSLLDANGQALEDFSASDVEPRNPRAVIGYYEPGHYCLVQVDGRGTLSALEEKADNEGMTLSQLAQLMQSLGCSAAYNLDGGQSAAMWFDGDIISTPYHNGRAVGDAIVLCEPPERPDSPDDFLVE